MRELCHARTGYCGKKNNRGKCSGLLFGSQFAFFRSIFEQMFNIRVYGLCLHNGGILVCREPFQGRTVTKFPGGGLEFGEGPEETLLREMREEIGQEIRILQHVYTTGFFIRSLRDPREQLISIYYRMIIPEPALVRGILDAGPNCEFSWLPVAELQASAFELPADRYVAERFLVAGSPGYSVINSPINPVKNP